MFLISPPSRPSWARKYYKRTTRYTISSSTNLVFTVCSFQNGCHWTVFLGPDPLDHIAHHIPTIFALGASPAAIRKHYQNNKSYQRPSKTSHQDVVRNLHDPAVFLKHLGQEAYYSDYLAFYQDQINLHGYEEVVNNCLFRGDECANAILVRMYAGVSASSCPFFHVCPLTRYPVLQVSYILSSIWDLASSSISRRSSLKHSPSMSLPPCTDIRIGVRCTQN